MYTQFKVFFDNMDKKSILLGRTPDAPNSNWKVIAKFIDRCDAEEVQALLEDDREDEELLLENILEGRCECLEKE